MTDRHNLLCWLWLASAAGADCHQTHDIIEAYGGAKEIYKHRFDAEMAQYITPRKLEALQNTEPEQFDITIAECEKSDVKIVAYDDNNYPRLLRDIPSCPPVLYYRGDITAASAPYTFAIVGTRRPSAYGMEATQLISKGLAEAGFVLVSGLATGLDSESHKAAIAADMPTIACIAFGHNNCYPAANKQLKAVIEQQGLVISEYPPATEPQKAYFLSRNRLIAGLSSGLCVAEARRVSGTMNTVRNALEFGRDVFAVPGSIFSPLCEGTNALLCDGAMPAVSANDILRRYGLEREIKTAQKKEQKQKKPDIILSDAAKRVFDALGCKPITFDAVCAAAQLPVPQTMAALTELELAGLISQLAGRQFCVK